MKTWVKIDAYDLEDDDMICGFKLKDLIIFATAAKKAGVDNVDLAKFARNVQSAYDFVIRDQKEAMEESLKRLSYKELTEVRK